MGRFRDMLKSNPAPLIALVTEYTATARAAGRTVVLIRFREKPFLVGQGGPTFWVPIPLRSTVIQAVEATGWYLEFQDISSEDGEETLSLTFRAK